MENNKVIDKNSAIPYYYQLIKFILEEISEGKLAPNDKIPSENELCKLFGVSRTVVRQAIQELIIEGHIETKKGIGSFISSPKIVDGMIKNLFGFHEDMTLKGYNVQTKVLSQKKITADIKVASFLGLEVGSQLIEIKRIRKLNAEIIVYLTNYLSFDLSPNLLNENLENKSLYNTLKSKYNIEIYSSKRTLGATVATEIDSKILEIKKGSPLIILNSISYSKNSKPIEYFHALYRADRIIFEVDLINTNYTNKEH